jgi:golgi-specific brefeldin A-resistance guanine nucleotide exchange factor 1
MRAPVVLHALSSFDDAVLEHTAPSIIAGLAGCLSSPTPLRIEIANSPDFWSILQRLHNHKTEAENVFEILCSVASSEPTAITADNYEAAVSLANDFAAQGSVGAVIEQRKQNPNARRQQGQQQQQRKGQASTQAPPADKPTPEKPSDEQTAVQRALKALSLVYNLTSLTPALIKHSHLDRNEAWAAYWSPIFRALCAQCINPCREVRRRAVSALQRVLLSDDLARTSSPTFRRLHSRSASKVEQPLHEHDSDDEDENEDIDEPVIEKQEWTSLFTEVLFPLILRLLKPEVYQLDIVGMGETRVQCATVLTKIFLRYLDLLAGLPPMIVEREIEVEEPPTPAEHGKPHDEPTQEPPPTTTKTLKDRRPWLLDIWSKTLQLLERLMNAGVGQREQEVMTEAVSEGVKNCLLVMQGGGFLERPEGNEEREDLKRRDKVVLWRETMRRVERVVPGLWGEVFPEVAAAAEVAEAATDVAGEGKGDGGDEGK